MCQIHSLVWTSKGSDMRNEQVSAVGIGTQSTQMLKTDMLQLREKQPILTKDF